MLIPEPFVRHDLAPPLLEAGGGTEDVAGRMRERRDGTSCTKYGTGVAGRTECAPRELT
jgi:hypothetical protein